MLGGDPDDLRALAQRLTTAAEGVDGVASAPAEANVWQGNAASKHAAEVEHIAGQSAALRGEIEEAASACAHLAEVVAERQEFLMNAWNEAKQAAEDGAEQAWDYAEDAAGWAEDQFEKVRFW